MRTFVLCLIGSLALCPSLTLADEEAPVTLILSLKYVPTEWEAPPPPPRRPPPMTMEAFAQGVVSAVTPVTIDSILPTTLRYDFVIEGGGTFTTVEALQDFLRTQKPGTRLIWDPGCARMGTMPLLDDPEGMAAFRAFCASIGIDFELVPSG